MALFSINLSIQREVYFIYLSCPVTFIDIFEQEPIWCPCQGNRSFGNIGITQVNTSRPAHCGRGVA